MENGGARDRFLGAALALRVSKGEQLVPVTGRVLRRIMADVPDAR